ncbi:shikimate kinase [Anaerosinus massiliensis]|uniref:shikimate kinase n=1 Tax=Massilibacillus massiliensis TaxID=1806837 RepID=UPI000AFD2FFF|nr:shikimate kinase [Massilibacillus massiliensis]
MKNIVLIGFMGTGKTSAGKLLANKLGYSFIDTDSKIEAENQMSIADMFVQHGEIYFRNKEVELIRRVSKFSSAVISTGGGVVLKKENLMALKENSIIITLTADVDVILERTSRRKNTRPLLNQNDKRKKIIDLLNDRAHLYKQSECMIDTSLLSPLQVVDEIIRFLKRGDELRA